MDALLAYLPEDRAWAIAHDLTLPERANGAALFADISGFTSLTEGLTQTLGPRVGIENLTDRINTVYARLTAAIAWWRGSVISFSGDAITCWFDDTDGPAAPRAAVCGLALQAAMAEFRTLPLPGGRTTALALKVAIATGPARRFTVGDPMLQQLDVLAGALLGRIAAGEQLTHPGEVLIDRATVAALGLHASLGEQRLDLDSREHFTLLRALADPPAAAPWVQVALPATALHPWVHQAIWSRHEAGLGAFLTELRRVVALFLRFGGIDFDIDDSAGEWLDAFIRRAQVVLANTGGSLLQLTVGDKGAYLYAAFGAPVAHEDDARRAARAALDLHALAADLGLPPFQIGLSQGIVRTGAYGGPTRQT